MVLLWNFGGGPPIETFQHKNEVIDGYCAAIGRDPATIERSVELGVNPNDWDATRTLVHSFIMARATHVILKLNAPYPAHIMHRLAQEVVEPLIAMHVSARAPVTQ